VWLENKFLKKYSNAIYGMLNNFEALEIFNLFWKIHGQYYLIEVKIIFFDINREIKFLLSNSFLFLLLYIPA